MNHYDILQKVGYISGGCSVLKGEMSYWKGREPGCTPWVDKGTPEDLSGGTIICGDMKHSPFVSTSTEPVNKRSYLLTFIDCKQAEVPRKDLLSVYMKKTNKTESIFHIPASLVCEIRIEDFIKMFISLEGRGREVLIEY